jgi:hypothetical protein
MADKTYQTTLLIRGDSKDAVKSVQLTRDELERLTGAQQKNAGISAKLGTAYKALGVGIAAAGGLAAGVLYKVIENTERQDAAMAQLNATLKSTGGASGKFAEELAKTAASLQQVTTYGDESIIEMQSLLLTFKNIKGDNFDRTTKSVLNMATAMKTDLKSAAIQLGKALNDPDKQLTALSRSGVTFTDGQKEQIKAMVEAGDVASAQTLILKELESQFGGSAEAAASTMGGALKQLSNNWGDLFEAEKSASDGMVESIHDINATISSPEFKESVQALVSGLISVVVHSAKALAGLSALGHSLVDVATGTTSSSTALQGMKDHAAGLELEMSKLVAAGKGSSQAFKVMAAQLDDLNKRIDISETFLVQNAGAQKTSSTATGKNTVSIEGNTDALEDNIKTYGLSESAAKKLAAEHAKLQSQIDKNAKSFQKAHSELDGMVRKTEDYIKALEFEAEQTTRTAREQAIENDLRSAGTRITAEQTARIREASAAKYDAEQASSDLAKAEEAAASASEQAWASARGTLSSFFFEMAADGKNAFDTLIDGFKAMLTKMVAEAAANRIFLTLGIGGAAGSASAGVAGGAGASGVAASGFSSSGGALLSGLSGGLAASGQAMYESIGTFASNNGLTGFGDAAYTKGLNTTATTIGFDIAGGLVGGYLGSKAFGETSGIGAGLGAVAGSIIIPVPGLGAAIGAFVGTGIEKGLSKLFGEKNDGANRGSASFSLLEGTVTGEGIGKSFDAENVSAAESLAQGLQDFSTAIGGSELSGRVLVGNKNGIEYNGQSYGQDSGAFLRDGFRQVIESATDLDERLKPLILRFDGTASEIADFAQLIYGIDKATGGVNDQMLTLLDRFKGGNAQIGQFASAIYSLQQSSGINTVTASIKEFAKAQITSAQAYKDHTNLLRNEITLFDGTADAASRMAQMFNDNKAAAYDFATAIKSVGQSLSEAAKTQAKGIRDSVLSEDELQYNRLVSRDYMIGVLGSIKDPEVLASVGQKILDVNQKAFDGLSDDEKLLQFESFASIAEATDATLQAGLKNFVSGLQLTQDELNARVISALEKAAGDQQAAATTQKLAADLMYRAAQLVSTAAGASLFGGETTV